MKKLLALLLTMVFVFVLAQSAFAYEVWYPETAWGIANPYNTLNSIEGIKTDKWGWYIKVDELNGTPAICGVYAGAGKNDFNKGTPIGTVTLSIDNGYYSAVFNPFGVHYITKMQLGVYGNLNDLIATDGTPGKFSNLVPAADAKYIVIHFDAQVKFWQP